MPGSIPVENTPLLTVIALVLVAHVFIALGYAIYGMLRRRRRPAMAELQIELVACTDEATVPPPSESPSELATPDDVFSEPSGTSNVAQPSGIPASRAAWEHAPSPSNSRYRSYSDVPWLRRSGTNTAFILIHLFTCGFVPLLLLTCVILVTGDVYYNKYDAYGKLKTWSFTNKIIAAIILLINIAAICTAFFGSPPQ